MDGDFQLFMLVYSIHLGLISLWVGGVVVAGLVVLGSAALAHEQERRERAAYVLSLSKTATVALMGIFGSGLYLAWQLLGSLGDLFGTQYGITLLAKLVLVGAAAAMGGINRFFVMPGLAAGEVPGQRAAMRFRTVLRAEALVLLAVLVVAAVLSSSPPPGAGM
jgi:putative copper resistance protein D